MQIREDIEPIERYLFLLLFAPDSSGRFSHPIRGNTWLQKQMFVLSKLNDQLAEDTEFDAYAMGAYSDTLAEVQDQFYISGFAERDNEEMRLTLDGRREAEKVWSHASDTERKTVTMVKTWLNDLTFNELLAVIYGMYPESASKSEVKPQVDARLPDLAVNLLRKGKVTFDFARRMTGMTSQQFEALLEAKRVSKSELETVQVLLDENLMKAIEKSRADSRSKRLVAWEKMDPTQ